MDRTVSVIRILFRYQLQLNANTISNEIQYERKSSEMLRSCDIQISNCKISTIDFSFLSQKTMSNV